MEAIIVGLKRQTGEVEMSLAGGGYISSHLKQAQDDKAKWQRLRRIAEEKLAALQAKLRGLA